MGPTARRLRATLASEIGRNRAADVTQLRRHFTAARAADHIADHVITTIDPDDPTGWAEQVAAALPPLTSTEAAAIGHLAATLDGRLTVTATAE